ncbi:MAG: DUF3526 domain-containing protein [Acidobacteriota bacterium]|nr:MAG: DUF3526 domain-containing protein [Acidobacteriota bacterium]
MFTSVVINEWRNLLAERSFLVLALVFAMLLGFGIYNGASWIKERSEKSSALLVAQKEDLADKKKKTAEGFEGSFEPGNFVPNPADPYTIGMSLQYAVLPFTPAAIFAVGQSDVLPIDAGVTISTLQRTISDKEIGENPLSFLAGRFDLAFVIIYLLPLFILALSFNILSGERESGILQILLSQPLTLRGLLTAKVTAQFGFIYILVTFVTLAGLLISGVSLFAEGFLLRALLWLALVFAYTLVWFAIAVFINSFGFSSATNAVACSAVWLVLVLVLPSLLNIVVSAVYPVPPRSELVAAERSVNLDMRKDGKRLLSEHYQDHPELMPKSEKPDLDDFGLAFVYVQREMKKRVDEVQERFNQQLAKQQELVGNLRYLSPAIIAGEATNDIAGTGLNRHKHFRTQVKEFDRSWGEFFVPKIYRLEKLSVEDFDKIPRFEYEEEPVSEVSTRVGLGILALLLMSAGLMFISFGKLNKYRLDK